MCARDLLTLVSVIPSVPPSRPGKLYSLHGNMSLDQECGTFLEEEGKSVGRKIGSKVLMTSHV